MDESNVAGIDDGGTQLEGFLVLVKKGVIYVAFMVSHGRVVRVQERSVGRDTQQCDP